MTDTIDEAPAATDAQATAERWFHDFEAALTAGDVDGAAGLFLEESFWRDLVSFTWNLKTVEGPAGSPTCSSRPWTRCSPAASRSPSHRPRPTA